MVEDFGSKVVINGVSELVLPIDFVKYLCQMGPSHSYRQLKVCPMSEI